MNGARSRPAIVGLIVLAVVLVLRMVATAKLQLVPEEAYYWMYAQHPGLSYFDHPPMVAWLIRAGTAIAGNTELGVRLGGALMMLVATALMYVFGRIWFGRAPAVAAALVLQLSPAYFGAGLIATMDAPLVCFWLVCLVGVSVAVGRQRPWGWYLAGIGCGAALLTKYTGAFLPLGALLILLTHPLWRRHLRSVHPYAAALIALAMFSPVIVWNSQHNWASFQFQLADRFAGHGFLVGRLTSFAALQLLVGTLPVIIGLGWICARSFRRRRWKTPRYLIAWAFSLPLLLAMGYVSAWDSSRLSWTMPAYLSALPAVAQLGLAYGRLVRTGVRRAVLNWTIALTIAVCLIANGLTLIYLTSFQPRFGWLPPFGPWPELAAAVQSAADQVQSETTREPLVIAGGKYRLASVMAFYRNSLNPAARAIDTTTSQWILGGPGLAYPYWTRRDDWIGRDCVVVDEGTGLERFASQFRTFTLVKQVSLNGETFQIGIGRELR